MDGAGDGASCEDLFLHSINSRNLTILTDIVVLVLLNRPASVESSLISLGDWRHTVPTHVEWVARVHGIVSVILHTRLVWDAHLESILIHTSRITSSTGAASLTVNDSLYIQVDLV